MSQTQSSWKVPIFTNSRTITLSLLNGSECDTPGAQLHMLTNISVKFQGSRSNTFGAMLNTSWKVPIFTNSRTITLSLLNWSECDTPGAQLDMLTNISVKFQDTKSNTFGAMLHTSWKVQIFTNSRAITLSLQNGSERKTPGAQLHMLTNIYVKFQDSRSNSFGARLHTTFWDGLTDGLTDRRTDGRTDRRTDGRTDKCKSICPPPLRVGA